MTLIHCEKLRLGYAGQALVEELSFSVERGDYLCIVGENGAGKSTLMRTLLGLQRPLAGEITLGDGLRTSQIGYLPQQSPAQRDFPASVREVVLSGFAGGCGWRPVYTGAEKRRAMERLRGLGLGALAGRCYRELSGGQQQRVLLARALCATDRLLLLDEPVSGLDPAAAAELYGLLEGLNRDEGVTLIMISHDLSAALRYASHILQLGDTVFFGTREAYLQSGAAAPLLRGGRAT